jgi:hypothetical protein
MAHSNPNFYDAIVAGISSSQDHWSNGSLTSSYVASVAEILYAAINPNTSSNLSADSGLLQSIVNGVFSTNHLIPSELADYNNIATAVNTLFQDLRVTLEQIGGGAATALQTTTTTVNVSNAEPPTAGQVLTANSASTATWQDAAPSAAVALQTTSTVVNVSNAPPPGAGQVLTATSGTSATWQDAAPSTTLVTMAVDIDLTVNGSSVIDTRPATPTGQGRWKLMSIDLRLKVGLGSGSSIISIGSTSGGQQIVLNQTILPATSVGTIVGGFALNTLGSGMSQVTGFEVVYPASQQIWANVTPSGSPSTGTITAYLLWQGLP